MSYESGFVLELGLLIEDSGPSVLSYGAIIKLHNVLVHLLVVLVVLPIDGDLVANDGMLVVLLHSLQARHVVMSQDLYQVVEDVW
jgi:hypothetical protein